MADKKDNDFRKQHRMRVKTKVYENGFSGLNDIDLLELMLFYAIPYKDVKPLAHRLIDTFGSLSRVLEADLGALENVEGMGASSAIFIKGICQTASRCMIERTCASDEPLDTKRACEIGISLLCMEKNEVFAAIFLDNSGNVLKAQKIFEGTVIAKHGGGISETFTVRRVAYGCGVEKTFPLHSPHVANVEVIRPGKVRRAKLYYLRDRVGKASKVKELN